jgi:TonB family protein
VVGYSQVIAGQTVVQKSTEPGTPSKKAAAFPRDNKVFSFVEQPPIFPGGDKAMNEFIRENLKYPAEALKNGKEGLVVIQFVVERNGKVYDAAVVKSLGDGTDEEALRVVELFPDFEPAKQNGKPVEFRFTLPIRFGLAPKDPANGYVPPSKANPDGSYLSTSGKEPAASSDCNPKLQLTLHGDNIKKVSYFEMAYEKPEGCSGDKYLVESIHYFILRDKVKLMEKTIPGNTLNLADVRAASQPGDVLNILVKGNSIPENKTNAPVPFQTGTVIPWK